MARRPQPFTRGRNQMSAVLYQVEGPVAVVTHELLIIRTLTVDERSSVCDDFRRRVGAFINPHRESACLCKSGVECFGIVCLKCH